jgi:hypothetical protein
MMCVECLNVGCCEHVTFVSTVCGLHRGCLCVSHHRMCGVACVPLFVAVIVCGCTSQSVPPPAVRLMYCGTAVEALQNVSRQASACAVFSAVSGDLLLTAVEVQIAATPLWGLAHRAPDAAHDASVMKQVCTPPASLRTSKRMCGVGHPGHPPI